MPISRQRSAGTAPASATSSRGTHTTDALRHVLPKRRADERRRRYRPKRRLSDPALAQKVRLLIMDRHWSLEEIDDISGSRVAAGASLSLPTILTGRSKPPPSSCRDPAPKARCGATCAARGLRRGARSRSYTAWMRGPSRPMRDLVSESGQTTRSWQRDPCACSCLPTGQPGCLPQEDATTTAGASLRPPSGFCRDARSRCSLRIGASSSQGIQMLQMPFEVYSSTSATLTIYGRS